MHYSYLTILLDGATHLKSIIQIYPYLNADGNVSYMFLPVVGCNDIPGLSSQLSRCVTARGSCTGPVAVGPTKV